MGNQSVEYRLESMKQKRDIMRFFFIIKFKNFSRALLRVDKKQLPAGRKRRN
jgi:hypothetical protein